MPNSMIYLNNLRYYTFEKSTAIFYLSYDNSPETIRRYSLNISSTIVNNTSRISDIKIV